MAFTPQWLDELRARTTLSTLIGQSVKLTRAGNEYKACCPFHNEKTPSFYINDAKGFYHCFGCSAHGDAIRWMTEYRGLGFVDAVKELAAAANMELPAPDPKAAQQAERRATLHDVMADAQSWFIEQLQGVAGADARDYLKRRGISAATAAEFGFGFAPDSRGALKEALAKHGDDKLVEAGLLISVDGKAPYDRFRGRLMIPIQDARGRVIAFGGRILGQGEPKYLNSPDTPLFDKGRTLYNLHRAAKASRQTGRLIVVEGYMDAIALAQAGFGDVVAPLGTALTETQIEMCWKLAEKPLLCFDGDPAGQRAAIKAAGRALPLLRPAHSMRFATLPPGQDPDDLLREAGKGAMQKLLDDAVPLLEQLWRFERAAQPIDTPEDKAGLRQRLAAHVDQIGDRDIAAHYRDAFYERTNSLFRPDRSDRNKGRPTYRGMQRAPFTAPKTETRSFVAKGEMRGHWAAVITGLIRYPALIYRHFEELQQIAIPDKTLQELLATIINAALSHDDLDREQLATILGEQHFSDRMDHILRADRLHFSFNSNSPDEQVGTRAKDDLDRVLRAMTSIPRLELALQRANMAAAEELTDATFLAQQQLRGQLQDQIDWLKQISQPEDVI